jgi:hypothetical protein
MVRTRRGIVYRLEGQCRGDSEVSAFWLDHIDRMWSMVEHGFRGDQLMLIICLSGVPEDVMGLIGCDMVVGRSREIVQCIEGLRDRPRHTCGGPGSGTKREKEN